MGKELFLCLSVPGGGGGEGSCQNSQRSHLLGAVEDEGQGLPLAEQMRWAGLRQLERLAQLTVDMAVMRLAAQVLNPRTLEAKTGGSTQVEDQPGVYSKL